MGLLVFRIGSFGGRNCLTTKARAVHQPCTEQAETKTLGCRRSASWMSGTHDKTLGRREPGQYECCKVCSNCIGTTVYEWRWLHSDDVQRGLMFLQRAQ